jgi:hypothetical protein
MQRLALLAMALLAVLVAVGCGGSDNSASTPLTKAEFIKQADALCVKGSEEIKAEAATSMKASESGKKGASQAQFTLVEEKVLFPGFQREVEEVRALGAPNGDGSQVSKILDAFEKGIEEVEEKPVTFLSGESPLSKPSGLADKYGFKACIIN